MPHAVTRDGKWFAIFDSHACNKTDPVDAVVKAVVHHKEIADVYRALKPDMKAETR